MSSIKVMFAIVILLFLLRGLFMPLDIRDTITQIILIMVPIIVLHIFVSKSAKKRNKIFHDYARLHGFQFYEDILYIKLGTLIPVLPVLRKKYLDSKILAPFFLPIKDKFNLFSLGIRFKYICDVLVKKEADCEKIYFSYSYEEPPRTFRSIYYYYALMIKFNNLHLPLFLLYKHKFFQNFLYKYRIENEIFKNKKLDVEEDAFSKLYGIYGKDHEKLKQLFEKSLLNRLSKYPNYYIEANENILLIYKREKINLFGKKEGINPKKLHQRISEATAIADMIATNAKNYLK